MYTRHNLLFRRCKHKVQGKLLPSRMIVTGVDMGRSFSVLLFCVAMDPVLTYLNRVPDMLTVQGYVDDTTMAGDTTAGMQWLTDAWNVCTRLRSAGIQIDQHHCWKVSGVHMDGVRSGFLDQHPLLELTQNLEDMPHFGRSYNQGRLQHHYDRLSCQPVSLPHPNRSRQFACGHVHGSN